LMPGPTYSVDGPDVSFAFHEVPVTRLELFVSDQIPKIVIEH
jgi:hypothetical protein